MSNRYHMLRLSSPGPRVSWISKLGNFLPNIFILLSIPGILGVLGYSIWRNHDLLQHGIEKSVLVMALDRTPRAPKTGTTFRYKLELEGRQFTHDFRVPLPVGRRVTMLTPPDDPQNLTPGSRNSTLFELFSTDVGGKWITLLLMIFLPFTFLLIPDLLLQVKRSWRKMLNR